jgi:hypothetical protein
MNTKEASETRINNTATDAGSDQPSVLLRSVIIVRSQKQHGTKPFLRITKRTKS